MEKAVNVARQFISRYLAFKPAVNRRSSVLVPSQFDGLSVKSPSGFAPLDSTLQNDQILSILQELKRSRMEVSSLQAPNRQESWSISQNLRRDAMIGPRFTQIDFSTQVF